MENVGGQASFEAPTAVDQPIRIQAVFSPKFNLAFLQNSVPVLLELALVNDSDQDLQDLSLALSSTPSLLFCEGVAGSLSLSGKNSLLIESDLVDSRSQVEKTRGGVMSIPCGPAQSSGLGRIYFRDFRHSSIFAGGVGIRTRQILSSSILAHSV